MAPNKNVRVLNFTKQKNVKWHFKCHNHVQRTRLRRQKVCHATFTSTKGPNKLLNLETFEVAGSQKELEDFSSIDLLSQLGKNRTISESHLRLRSTTHTAPGISEKEPEIESANPRDPNQIDIDWQGLVNTWQSRV